MPTYSNDFPDWDSDVWFVDFHNPLFPSSLIAVGGFFLASLIAVIAYMERFKHFNKEKAKHFDATEVLTPYSPIR